MFLFCFYPWLYILIIKLLAVKLLIFSVSLSTHSAIYSENFVLYLANFNHALKVFRGLFFAFPFYRKDALGDECLLLVIIYHLQKKKKNAFIYFDKSVDVLRHNSFLRTDFNRMKKDFPFFRIF